MDIAAWLDGLGLKQYEQAFRANHIDRELLATLTADNLREMGVASVGHRKRLLAAIVALADAKPVAPGTSAEPGSSPQAERRQLTVMFVDLVGSTALGSSLDPEEMGGVLRAYQNAVAGELARFEGHVTRFLGDGVLAYFGWPRAQEDAAERAVRAGLAVTAAVGSLRAPGGAPLRARVGIATGLVVVGELAGKGAAREEVVIGGTPNLAARLQAIAKPGTVVVAPSTRQLIGGLFECIDLRARRLKGFVAPVRAWHVVGTKEAESRFEALRGASPGRMVGRDQELALLVDRWGKVKDGEGQAVLLSGEAGVGKSRLVRALYDRLRTEPGTRMRLQCSPYHVNSALWPMIIYLERAARLDRDASAETRRRSLAAAFTPRTVAAEADLPLFLELLGIPGDDSRPLLSLTPQQKKRRIFNALISYLQSLAQRQPVLMVLEDAQWMDPTTREFFDSVVEGVGRLPVLLVVIARPDALPLWAGHLHVTVLMLSRLSVRHVDELIDLVANGTAALPKEAIEQIRVRADGVPLFIEELTKTVIETRPVREVSGRFELARPLPPLAIPATLRDSLVARLDRLQPAKAVAQAGAVLGREFSYELLAAVSRLREGTLRSALDRLGEAGLILPRGAPPEATYVFKHALVRDAAYETLLRSERPLLHARVVCALEERFPGTAELEPELLAHHCAEAGLAEKSVGYRLTAGRRAIARSALPEAVAQLFRGLEELTRVPHEATRLRLELELQVALGIALAIARGWPATEMGQAFARARELCAFLDSDAELFQALYGLAIFHLMRAEPETTRRLALEMLDRAAKCDDAGLKIAARQVLGSAFHVSGRFADAQSQYVQLLGLYNLERATASRFTHFFDPGAATLSILARVGDVVVTHSRQHGVEIADEIRHRGAGSDAEPKRCRRLSARSVPSCQSRSGWNARRCLPRRQWLAAGGRVHRGGERAQERPAGAGKCPGRLQALRCRPGCVFCSVIPRKQWCGQRRRSPRRTNSSIRPPRPLSSFTAASSCNCSARERYSVRRLRRELALSLLSAAQVGVTT